MSKQEEMDAGDSTQELESEDDLLQARLEEAQREVDQFRNLLQRVQADSLNYKRRVEEEREELQRQANANLVLRLLPVLDDFDRALRHIPRDDAISAWLAGVELVGRNLTTVLESFGVTRIDALDAQFDPAEHESLAYEVSDSSEEGTVLSIIREGYKFNGRVLRPAQVTVSRKSEDQSIGKETS